MDVQVLAFRDISPKPRSESAWLMQYQKVCFPIRAEPRLSSADIYQAARVHLPSSLLACRDQQHFGRERHVKSPVAIPRESVACLAPRGSRQCDTCTQLVRPQAACQLSSPVTHHLFLFASITLSSPGPQSRAICRAALGSGTGTGTGTRPAGATTDQRSSLISAHKGSGSASTCSYQPVRVACCRVVIRWKAIGPIMPILEVDTFASASRPVEAKPPGAPNPCTVKCLN